MAKVLCYTRTELEDILYSKKLAYSVHLAIQEKDGSWLPLNHNSGICYVKATSNEDGTLNAKSLRNPILFADKNRGYCIIAERIETDGTKDKEQAGKLVSFDSCDLIHFTERDIKDISQAEAVLAEADHNQSTYFCVPTGLEGKVNVEKANMTGLPEGAIICSMIEVDEEIEKHLRTRFLTPFNTENVVPAEVRAKSIADLMKIKAIAKYSDGSSVEKKVDWYTETVDFGKPGEYEVEGKVHQDHFPFPLAWDRADPCIGKWNGKYYFIATNDADCNHSFYIREADTIPGLVTAQEVKILDTTMYPHLGNLLWAPEFHIIKDRLYIFHAGTPEPFGEEQCHLMALKEGGNPMKAADWEMPVRMLRKDGSMLYGKQGITLDMTEFEAGGKYYVCWSQRQFVPVDQGAWLMIAELNPNEPWKLLSDPVVLSKPEFGWANNHTFVDEGPYVFKRDGKVFMSFSSAAVDATYVAGMMVAKEGSDLLDTTNWVKENCPLISSRSVKTSVAENGYTADKTATGEFGPGHNSFVEDEDGNYYFVYHAKRGVNGPRSSGLRRMHFNADGFPVLDMTEELDLKPELTFVKTSVIVE